MLTRRFAGEMYRTYRLDDRSPKMVVLTGAYIDEGDPALTSHSCGAHDLAEIFEGLIPLREGRSISAPQQVKITIELLD